MNGTSTVDLLSTANQIEYGFFQALGVAQIIGYTLIVLFLAGIIYLVIGLLDVKANAQDAFNAHFIQKKGVKEVSSQQKRWDKVKQAFTSPDEQLWRMGIIEADTLLEELVESMGYRGETFGEMLKSIHPSDVPWIDAAWEVHRLRNIIAHEGSRYHLNQREAYRAYKIYESILYESGMIS